MTANRNDEDDLHGRLNELEATVRGLTQELVEANERIRQLEDELDTEAEPEYIEADDGGEDADSDTAKTDDEPALESETDEATEEDDIIVA